MYDLQTLQLAITHLSVALRLVDHMGLSVPGALIDEALHALKRDLEETVGKRPRELEDTVDFSLLEAMAIDSINKAIERTAGSGNKG